MTERTEAPAGSEGDGPWDRIVGQARAVGVLARAAARPGHAYLLAGPRGSGVEDAARCFAAALAGGTDRAFDLAARGVHPDVVEFEPGGASYRVREDIRERVLPEAARAPVEAERKVLVLLEAERLRGNQHEAANALLKTLEEPPPRTVVLLVTSAPDDLLPTIRSRCQRIDLDPVDAATLRRVLEAEGVDATRAALAVGLAGGHLARARALAGPLAELRATFVTLAARVDGSGAAAVVLAEEAAAAVDAAAGEVARRQEAELEAFDVEMAEAGYSDRESRRLRRRIEERHKREARRVRQDLLVEGVTALETVYRDALAPEVEPLNADRARVVVPARRAAEALDACREARRAFLVNEKGTLHLEHLLLALPPGRLDG